MSLSPERLQELIPLLEAVREGHASEEQLSQLCSVVSTDRDVRRLYLQYTFIASSLRWNFSGGIDGVRPQTIAAPQHITRWLPKVSPRWFAAAASLLLAGYFIVVVGMLAWDRMHRRAANEQIAKAADTANATLVATSDCRWAKGESLVAGTDLKRRVLELKSGEAELRFADGARVVLQGPAKFETQSSSRGYLHHGRLSAVAPPAAAGFRIDTPLAVIVDLGTEFEVATDAKSGTRVQVHQGKVDVLPNVPEIDANSLRQPRHLVAGESVKIIAGKGPTPIIEPTGAVSNRIVRPPSRDDNNFAAGDVVFDYQRDFAKFGQLTAEQQSAQKFPVGWQFFWNAGGPIGDPKHYEPLSWHRGTYRFLPNGSSYGGDPEITEKSAIRYAQFFVRGGHPGPGAIQSAIQSAAADRYVIACATVTEPGRYAIANSSIACDHKPVVEMPYSPGVQLMVLVNNEREPRKSLVVEPLKEPAMFDLSLGELRAGDRIWIAVGPRGMDANDLFMWDFRLVRQIKTLASE